MLHSYRKRRRPTRAAIFYSFLAVLFVGLNFFLADDAHAATKPEMTVEFDNLRMTKRKGKLVLNYEVTRKDWRAMRQNEMAPRVNLYLRDRRGSTFTYAYSAPIDSRIGRIVYPHAVKLRGTKVVELAVVGFSGFHHVAQTRHGDACGDRVRLRVRAGGKVAAPKPKKKPKKKPVRPRRGHHTATLIKACQEAGRHSSDLPACLKLARALPSHVDAAATVRACGNATTWSSELNSCLDEASVVQTKPAAVVTACASATRWNSELKSCIRKSASLPHLAPAAVVKACSDATSWHSELNACLDRAGKLGRRPAPTIRACSDATRWNSDFNACLEQARRGRHPA